MSTNNSAVILNPTSKTLEAMGEGMSICRLSTAQRVALTPGQSGVIVYDVTLAAYFQWNGSAWVGLSAGSSIEQYTVVGTTNWNKPAGAKLIKVVCKGGSGGGGSVRKGAAGSVRGGGGGGGGCGVSKWLFNAADLTDIVAVTVGDGGAGGAAVSANDTNGNDGTNGANTIQRGHPITLAIGKGLKLTDKQMDDLFIQAANVV